VAESPTVSDLRRRISEVMIRDRGRLGRRLDRAGDDASLTRIEEAVAGAEARHRRRAAGVPPVTYPDDLPVSARRLEIMDTIRDHQVVVVAGETGSGKTTQLPKMCLELGRGVDGLIGHTQPRRIAARTVAERLSDELGVDLGTAVGYSVRFTDRVGENTLVKVMTDGILLAEIRRERELTAYDTIIVDEAHERSLNIDFLLGYLTGLLPRRPDLKVVITSATIDTERFARHFDAPVVEVSGRTWPVEVRYRPLGGEPSGGRAAPPRPDAGDARAGAAPAAPGDPDGEEVGDGDLNTALCQAVSHLTAAGPGDVLVFLPGERDIRDAADALRHSELPGLDQLDILPLYARLSAAEQHRVFRPHRGRRVVLATNVAETSLTVPGIRFVVDSGLARISRYSHRTKVQRLPIERISRASADQRAGRCGRLGPGICVRLYAEEDYSARPEFTDPEILRTNLASVILQMAAVGLGQIEHFPFLEPPDRRSIADGRALLEELGAFEPTPHGPRLTDTGRRLAELPLDPRLGRMVVEAERHGCLREVIVIAAALSIQDPRERPTDRPAEAAELHRRFEVTGSDFLAYLSLWDYVAGLQADLSGHQFRKRCRAEFLHVLRLREWQDVASQIRQVARARGMSANREPAHPDQIHQALLAGLLSHVGMRDGARGDYGGARNSRWQLGRSSSLSRRPPAWVMAGELVETERTWARTAARIEPAWAERAGRHLLKRTWSDPWWDPHAGEARTEERATLYGLPVVAARAVPLWRTDAEEARRMFIRHALVDGDWRGRVAPLATTEARTASIRALEERVRRRDLTAGPEALADFYESVLPADIGSANRFERWWRRTGRHHPERLEVPFTVLLDRRGGPVDLAGYPESWRQGDLELALRYRFEPGAPDDGATVEIPVAVLNRVTGAGFDWGIPGYRPDLVAALVRALPKEARRALGPAPQVAAEVLARAGPADGPLLEVVAARLARMSGIAVSAASWEVEVLPPHLRLAFEVTDGDAVLGRGRDLERLRRALAPEVRAALDRAAPELIRHGCRQWDFGDLPPVVERGQVRAYPALTDEGDAVGVGLFESESAQARSMWNATRRLLALSNPWPTAHLQHRLTNETKLALARSGRSIDDLLDDCAEAVLDQVIVAHGGPTGQERGFAAMNAVVRDTLVERVARLATIAGGVLATASLILDEVDRLDRRDPTGNLKPALSDIRAQVEDLIGPGFVTASGPSRLRDLLRYLDAAGRRLSRLPADVRRDADRQAVIQGLTARYSALLDRLILDPATGPDPADHRRRSGPELAAVRWMLEELRVSLWAQQLGTATPVSEQRVARALEHLGG
jgi:ATP-dependent RNA helicase HrpA